MGLGLSLGLVVVGGGVRLSGAMEIDLSFLIA